jgi:hypothetical protein
MNTFWTTTGRLILAIAFPLVIVAGGIKTAPKIVQLKGLNDRRDDLLQHIEIKNEEIKILKDNQSRFMRDPDFIEYILRLNKRVKEGEYVFVIESKLAD